MKKLTIFLLILIVACILDFKEQTINLAMIAIIFYVLFFIVWACWQGIEPFIRPLKKIQAKAQADGSGLTQLNAEYARRKSRIKRLRLSPEMREAELEALRDWYEQGCEAVQ